MHRVHVRNDKENFIIETGRISTTSANATDRHIKLRNLWEEGEASKAGRGENPTENNPLV